MAPTASNLAAAVQAAVEELGVGDYHVAGYSLGARVAIHMATTHSVQSLIAIAPDGLGTPLERVQGYLALIVGRATAIALAPLAGQLSRSDVGRSLFFAGTRSLPWQLTAADAHHLLTDFAAAPAYEATNWAAMFDSPTGLDRLTCPTLFLQGTADPLIAQQALRYPAFIAHAQLRWLPGLNHVPISDDPAAVAEHMLTFLHRPGPAATAIPAAPPTAG
jgi:pimeloyl-ACP methyl ester carboxylesterase